mgnify:CR=1 FL=1
MIRVLHVVESLAAGGIETTFLNILRAWREAPPWAIHEVLALSGGVLEAPYQQAADAVTIAASGDALERVVLGPYDVVYFTFERCAYRLLPLVVSRGRAAVVYGKGYDMGGMFRLNDGLAWQPDESMMWAADHVTFTTDRLAAGFAVPPARATVLGKAAAVRRFAALPSADVSTPNRIVCVANLHARKRLGDLVRAVARLRPEVGDLSVRFVGADGAGEGGRLAALASDLGISEACEIVGRRVDVADDLAASRIFALPSGCEGVPTAMLEAMAAARPVVMTDVGHVTSAVTDGVEGYVVAAGDVDALTDRLRRLLTDPVRARSMGLAARARAMGHDVVTVASRLRGVLAAAGGVRAA